MPADHLTAHLLLQLLLLREQCCELRGADLLHAVHHDLAPTRDALQLQVHRSLRVVCSHVQDVRVAPQLHHVDGHGLVGHDVHHVAAEALIRLQHQFCQLRERHVHVAVLGLHVRVLAHHRAD